MGEGVLHGCVCFCMLSGVCCKGRWLVGDVCGCVCLDVYVCV